MPPGLGFLGAEGGSERVDQPERSGRRFAIQLTGLREVCRPFLEVLRFEQSAALADCRRQNRRIHPQKATLIEEVVNRLLDFVSNNEDGALLRASEPQVSLVEQEV